MKSKYPKWVTRQKKQGTAVHKIGGKYYLYEVGSRWDRKKKRARKITKGYLGVITPEGIKEPKYKRNKPTTMKEYGASRYLIKNNGEVIEGLKKYFPDWWAEIFVISCLRLMKHSPLKNMLVHYQDMWLSEEMEKVKLYERAVHQLLEEVGRDRSMIAAFLKNIASEKEGVLIDLTHIFSSASNMQIRAKGYNNKFDFNPQVNVLFMFSTQKKMPLFYRVLPGNVRDVSSLKATIAESQMKNITLIGDKGFYSRANIKMLGKEELQYILPLKRNNSLIDYGPLKKGSKKVFEGYFRYKKRHIWYYRSKRGNLPVWVFIDERLKVAEEEDYLSRIETHPEFGYTIEGFHKKHPTFGTIAMITNLEALPAKKVFYYFKSRAEIEILFDTFKNVLHADRLYMRNDYCMETWMFINYLALIYYYKIYRLLLETELLSKYSPSDFLLHLARIRKVKISNHWIDLEIPKQSRILMEKSSLSQ